MIDDLPPGVDGRADGRRLALERGDRVGVTREDRTLTGRQPADDLAGTIHRLDGVRQAEQAERFQRALGDRQR